MSEAKERKIHYDILRILAAFSVVMLHSAAQWWYDVDLRSIKWIIANTYDVMFRFGVPVFVMISGAIFLDKKYKLDVNRLYKHNIVRLIVFYIIWSCAYGLFDCRYLNLQEMGVKGVLREMLYGRYHLWFIPMIVGIYVLLPILRGWIDNTSKKNIEYFLVVFFVLQICGETVKALTVSDELHYIINLGKVEMACGYIGYFVLGYYISHIGIKERLKQIIYILFVPSVLLNVILGILLSWKVNRPVGTIYDSFGLFTFIIVLNIFIFVSEKKEKTKFGSNLQKIVREISDDTLGIYVLHVGIIEYTQLIVKQNMKVSILVGIPIYAIVCFTVSALVAAILRRIPFVGRFLC